MVQFLMNESKGVERSLEGVARRMLAINFAAIHAISQTLTQVLYRLLANPGHVGPLRREVKVIVAEYGWTTAGLDKMHKIDTFVRGTQRVDGLSTYEFDGFAFRGSESPVWVQWQVGIQLALHPPHICLSGMDGTHATEMKVVLARIVATYDFKLEEGKEIPRDLYQSSREMRTYCLGNVGIRLGIRINPAVNGCILSVY
ncbi:hypothetical protein EDB92DRAFT_1814108 [Lactarius akahatsu]|uniref:Cytochrome P450 n=1 Tax=Lactarius akahatsu TaxID=416441 RepID=A0AAD4LQL4_9AGAM|nr:hypothetical protein EDB92DRAFT_1814108 [Lactarius akahatsu]